MPILVGYPVSGGPGVPGAQLHAGLVSLGNVTFGMTDSFGAEWVLESISGWASPVTSTGSVTQRSADDGGWSDDAYRAPRTIELAGTVIAADWPSAEAAVDRLVSGLSVSTLTTLTVATQTRTLTAAVRQDGQPSFNILDHWATFSVGLIAPDPRRYDAAVQSANTGLPQTTGGLAAPFSVPFSIPATSSSGVISLTNMGNSDTPQTMTLTGPCPPCTITHVNSGRTLRVPINLAAGRTLTLDADSRTAWLDGQVSQAVSGAWFRLAPGVNQVAFSAATYNASSVLSVSYRSAWK